MLLASACAANMVADIYLLNGVKETNWQPALTALIKTGFVFVKWVALSSIVLIPVWFLIVPYILELGGSIGYFAVIFWCSYVGITLAFHTS